MDNRTEALAEGVWQVEVGYALNAFVLANDGSGDGAGLTIIDTGTGSGGPRLVRSVRMLGFDPRSIRDIWLTHWHRDHTGSAARFAASSAAPNVWVGAGDRAVVAGEMPPARPTDDDATPLGRAIARFNRPGTRVPAVRALVPGMRTEVAGGTKVIATPGHTAGHVSFLLTGRRVLIAGDALMNVLRLSQGPKALSTALSARCETIERLAGLDFDVLAVGHGAPVLQRARERVVALRDAVCKRAGRSA